MKARVTVTLEVFLGNGTTLVEEPVRRIRCRDGETAFFLNTPDIFTPMGMPVSFRVDIGPKGKGLSVRSAGALLLAIYSFDVNHSVRFRLATDEVVDIRLYERRDL